MPPPKGTIAFYSGAKKPLNTLSNLYRSPGRNITVTWPEDIESVPVFLRGKSWVYPTREHAYQSLRAIDLPTAECLMKGGRLAGWKAFERWPSKTKGKATEDIREKTETYWGAKGMMGIVAKMAVSARWKDLSFKKRELSDDEDIIRIWRLIHAAFFIKGAPETETLLNTRGKKLAEFHRSSKADTYYCCKFELCGKRVGKNRMGIMLQAFRDAL